MKTSSRQLRLSLGLLTGSALSAAIIGCDGGSAGEDLSSIMNGIDRGSMGNVKDITDVRATCEKNRVGPRMLRRLTSGEIDFSLRSIFPVLNNDWVGAKVASDPVGTIGFTTDAAALKVGGTTAREIIETGEEVGDLLTSDANFKQVLPCSASSPNADCAKEYVSRYGYLLFRRPLSDAEVTKYTDYAMSVAKRSDFKSGIKWTTVALFQSPHSIYRTELGSENGDFFALNQFEVATELAFTYSGAGPDKELLDLAAAGGLKGSEARKAQAKRLINAEVPVGGGNRGKWRALDFFFDEWLRYREIEGKTRDVAPNFPTISSEMVKETRAFLLTQILQDKATLQTLMTTRTTYLSGLLANFYGFGDKSASDFQPAERPEGQGIGLLAQSSLLAATAHQGETSPTLRGLLFYRRFLCNPRPVPPAIVPTLQQTVSEATNASPKTTREKFELIHEKRGADCATCHANFDPFGFTFEHFDETGRYRATEKSEAINALATVQMNDSSTLAINGQEELANLVKTSDDIENCVTGLMANFYLSGGGGTNCLAEEARRKVAMGEMSIEDYYISLVDAPQFVLRNK